MTDFVLMVEETSYMFITGPEVVKTVTGEEVTFEELGGAATHASKSGVAHLTARNEEEALEDARYLLSFLPQNNAEPPPYFEPSDPVDREDAELDSIVPDNPNKPYDMRDVVTRVVDDGDFLEMQPLWAENIVCGFARLGGHSGRGSWRTTRVRSPGRSTSTPPSRARASSVLRRVQHPARHVRRRSGLPPGHSAGMGRHHPARREAPLRLLRGDRPEDRAASRARPTAAPTTS